MKNNDNKKTIKKVLVIAARFLICVLLAGGILLLARSLINKIYLINYQNGRYSEFPENLLVPVELGENYVAPYNVGNVKYQQGDYEMAARYYYTALQKNPPEEKECMIRINLALALLHTYPFETMDTENEAEVEEALKVLYTARSFLTENGCASEEFGTADGHSAEAEKLKHDIDEMIMKLQAQQQNGGGSDSEHKSGGGDGNDDQDPSGGGQDEKDQGGSSGNSGESEEEQKQKELKQQLQDQKKDLDEGNYSGGRSSDYQYVEGGGEMSGYGEGTPW